MLCQVKFEHRFFSRKLKRKKCSWGADTGETKTYWRVESERVLMKDWRTPRNAFKRSECSAFWCLSLSSLPWGSSRLVPSQDTTFCTGIRGEGSSPAVLYSSHKNQRGITSWGTALARVLRFIPCPPLPLTTYWHNIFSIILSIFQIKYWFK